MQLEQLVRRIEKRSKAGTLHLRLNPPASEIQLADAERRIGKPLPDQIRAFYSTLNGLIVDAPAFHIHPVDELGLDTPSRLHFATADNMHRICFACTELNPARQWDVVACDTGKRITLTMASFLSVLMWKWIDHRIPFWTGEQ